VALRRGRITDAEAEDFFADLSLLDIRIDDSPTRPESLWRTASATRLTAYDAAYLDLAEVHGLALATQDAELRRAARRAGVQLL
jgi:predicted nucleic acid-binding protein